MMKKVIPLFCVAVVLAWIVIAGRQQHTKNVYAQMSSLASASMAGIGSPTANSIPCNSGVASSTTASFYIDRSIPSNQNAIYRCTLATDGVTYAWLAPFTAGNQLFYGSSGLLAGSKCWLGSVTSNTSGQATVNWSSAGFTAAPQVQVQPVATGTTASAMVWASPSSVTSTGANITVTTPATISILGALSIQLASSAYTVSVIACGS